MPVMFPPGRLRLGTKPGISEIGGASFLDGAVLVARNPLDQLPGFRGHVDRLVLQVGQRPGEAGETIRERRVLVEQDERLAP